ncbi:Serine proteinase stubble [Portunus trituberculatus]|uniref:Serine proteinase stubble n=1 Tax=Portunus trituberculatus TaxID=210409 RepID=A0A5B7CWP8_PORTR|nr:Serine proteinase stubble [Portunus trituberculatus]
MLLTRKETSSNCSPDKGGTKSSLSRTKHRRVSGCGTPRISQFAKRIIGGDEARFGEFPWQAHIRISGYQCGGVLVNHFFVATAAHCVHKARLNQITVHLGEFDTKDTGEHEEPLPKETFAVVEKRIHPMFKYMLTQPDRYDIAVLRLNRPVIYRANILPICLPDPNDNFIGDVGIVAGWGKTDNSFGKTGTNILRKVLVPIISNDECLSWHHHKGIDVKLHYEMFCAGHSQGKMDACLGDSGGPLVVEKDGRWVLAGITSAGFGCAVDHQPGIYHKVSVTAGWVTGSVRTSINDDQDINHGPPVPVVVVSVTPVLVVVEPVTPEGPPVPVLVEVTSVTPVPTVVVVVKGVTEEQASARRDDCMALVSGNKLYNVNNHKMIIPRFRWFFLVHAEALHTVSVRYITK